MLLLTIINVLFFDIIINISLNTKIEICYIKLFLKIILIINNKLCKYEQKLEILKLNIDFMVINFTYFF